MQAVSLLVERGLISSTEVVRRGVRVFDLSRRNVCVAVMVESGPSYFCKMAKADRQSEGSVRREIAAYGRLESMLTAAGHKPLSRAVFVEPLLLDDQCPLIVLPLLAGDATAHVFLGPPPGRASLGLRSLGRGMGRLHGCTDVGTDGAALPWALTLACPPLEVVEEFGGGAVEALEIVHSHAEVVERIEALASSWGPTCWIHGDLRVENLVAGASGDSEVQAVDWESLGPGRPEWDIGFLIATLMRKLVFSIELDGKPSSAGWLRSVAALSETFSGYAEERGTPEAVRVWSDAVHCVPAGLAQAAVETGMQSARITRSAVLLLQAALNWTRRGPRLNDLVGEPLSLSGREEEAC
ncbi:phosphotransferase family protein [Streptomyces tanashiensis]|uniref:Phosphotransferase n=1 Tax=Streptomyces tanashiensis TaxID=67367 RepID=A0ABY6QRY8_9ACTN|nr:phosphotransferase [Streptomyces tanashiensis]UZX19848.1 phosphotransferase [Streptomyces tanashiensis]